MLELQVSTHRRRVGALRRAILDECEQSGAEIDHAATVAFVTEQLLGDRERSRRHATALLVVAVHADATTVMLREAHTCRAELDSQRQRVLDHYASRWSTMYSSDERTIWAEIPRLTLQTRAEPSRSARSGLA